MHADSVTFLPSVPLPAVYQHHLTQNSWLFISSEEGGEMTNTEKIYTVYGNKSPNGESRPKKVEKKDKHAKTIPRVLYNISLGILGHSDQFISSLSPLIIISRPLTTAIMKLSVKKQQQLRHPVYYLKVRRSPTFLAMQHKHEVLM